MARIDARRGRVAGVRAGITTPRQIAETGDLGLSAVANVLDQRGAITDAKRAEAERGEDALAITEATSDFRLNASKHFDERADGFDGSGGPFADNVAGELDDLLEERLVDQPERRVNALKQRLIGVRDQLTLAAFDFEDKQREKFALSRLSDTAQGETNAILSDPAHFETALESLDNLAVAAPAAMRRNFIDDQRGAYAAAYGEARLRDDPAGYRDELDGGDLDQLLAPGVKASQLKAATREIDRRAKEDKRDVEKRQAAAGKAVSTEIDALEKNVSLGLPISDDRIEALGAVALQGGEAAQREYAEASDIIRASTAIQDLPPSQGAKLVAEERARLIGKSNASPFEARRVEVLEQTLSGMETRLSQDFAGYLIDRGETKALDPSGLTGEALAARASTVEAEADFFGVPAQYFSETERTALGRLDPGGSEMLQIAGALASHPRGREMLAELAPKNPELAHLGGILASGGEAAFVEDAVAGAAARGEDGFDSSVATGIDGAASIASDVYGAAFALKPDTARATRNAAELAYEGQSQRRGRTKDDFDGKDFERTLQRAAGGVYVKDGRREVLYGGVADFGKRKVHAPSWIKNAEFERNYRLLTEKDFAEAGGVGFTGTGEEILPRDLRKATPVAVDEGRYQLAFGDPASDPQWVIDADSAPYVLDLNKIRARFNSPPALDIFITRAF
jgi:hypothetical protein